MIFKADALLAPNGVVAGDSFGNGHFLTSGGAMTGMVGHSWRVYEYYQARDAGVSHEEAIRTVLSLSDNPKAASANPKDFYDNSLLKELEDSGFVKELYSH